MSGILRVFRLVCKNRYKVKGLLKASPQYTLELSAFTSLMLLRFYHAKSVLQSCLHVNFS